MNKPISLMVGVFLLAACSENGGLLREASEACGVPHSFSCTPELAAIAPLKTLKANGHELTVNCGIVSRLDVSYRESCTTRLTRLAETLTARWGSVLSPITLSDMTLTDEQTCIDTFIPGREGVDCEFFYITAEVPLRWVQSK